MFTLGPRQEGWIKESRLFRTPTSTPSFLHLNIKYGSSGKCSHLQNKGISEPFFPFKNPIFSASLDNPALLSSHLFRSLFPFRLLRRKFG